MRQIRSEFRSNFENISRDSLASVARRLRDIRESVSRLSRECNLFSFKFVRQSYECRATFVRMSLSFIFSPDSREVFARLSRDRLATLARHSYECRENFALEIRQNFAATSSRHSHDRRATVARQSRNSLAKYFGEKIRIKFLNMFKNFATSSRHKKILTTLARHSHESCAKVRDKIHKTLARYSHASEILALCEFFR